MSFVIVNIGTTKTGRKCKNITCQNGGTCVDGVDDFLCWCSLGYRGRYCEEDIDECSFPDVCDNGATCTQGKNFFTCNCCKGGFGCYCENATLCAAITPNQTIKPPTETLNGKYFTLSSWNVLIDTKYAAAKQ